MKNARFWTYINDSHVKITLQPDQVLNWSKRFEGDEGPGWEAETWEYDSFDKVITNKWARCERDCDGVHKRGGESYCKLDELRLNKHYEKPLFMPNWKLEEEWNRDLRAELAGY